MRRWTNVACLAITAALMLIVLAACADTRPRTASQASYQATVGFTAALKAANGYNSLPRCSAVVKDPCSRQEVVDRIKAEAAKADQAVMATQAIAADSRSTDTDVNKAVAAANHAVEALLNIVPK